MEAPSLSVKTGTSASDNRPLVIPVARHGPGLCPAAFRPKMTP
jgi:hypothetical protein